MSTITNADIRIARANADIADRALLATMDRIVRAHTVRGAVPGRGDLNAIPLSQAERDEIFRRALTLKEWRAEEWRLLAEAGDVKP